MHIAVFNGYDTYIVVKFSSEMIRKPTKIRNTRKCKICKERLIGRSDKIFCSSECKSYYHRRLLETTQDAASNIVKILYRNRSILLEIMGKKSKTKKVSRQILDAKKFNWMYVTQYHLNSRNKMVNYVFDFSWIVFSDQEILIKRIKS